MKITRIYHHFSLAYAFFIPSRTWNLNKVACATQEMHGLQGDMNHCLSNTCSPAPSINDSAGFANDALGPSQALFSLPWPGVQFRCGCFWWTCTSHSCSSFLEGALSFWKMPDSSSRKLNPSLRMELSVALTSSSNWLSSIWVLFQKGTFLRGYHQQTLVRLVTRRNN